MLASVRLEEGSPTGCAVTTWRDQLYLAWTAINGDIVLAWSADGRVITSKQRLDHRSTMPAAVAKAGGTVVFPPAMAGADARLWLAWRDSHGINMCDAEHPDHPPPVTFGAWGWSPPSLTATGRGGAAVAWRGDGRRVHLLTVTEDPSGGSMRAGEEIRLDVAKSRNTPAVCSHQGRLIVAWAGTDRRINLLTVTADGPGAPVQLEQARSRHHPALCSHQDRLILAWIGTDSHINLASVQ
jgi:hypothetical protein